MEKRSVVPEVWGGEGLTIKREHNGVFWSDGTILYLHYGGAYTKLSMC